MIKIVVLGAVCACVGAFRFGGEAPASTAAGANRHCHPAAACESPAIPAHASVDRVFTILAMR